MPKPSVADLIDHARAALARAYAPHSKYRVGACLRTTYGRLFTGCNVENASYGLTVCAERVAVCNAVSAGSRDFTDIAIVSDPPGQPYPCGACLQVMAEFCAPAFKIHVATGETGSVESFVLQELLTKSFTLDSG